MDITGEYKGNTGKDRSGEFLQFPVLIPVYYSGYPRVRRLLGIYLEYRWEYIGDY